MATRATQIAPTRTHSSRLCWDRHAHRQSVCTWYAAATPTRAPLPAALVPAQMLHLYSRLTDEVTSPLHSLSL
jgi:hypothetical protein